jgi:hypothetical protein
MELSKADKKAAREIIEKGLQQEFAAGLERSYQILADWKAGNINNREAYHELYGHIRDCDKHIARRYDNMKGSTYLLIIAGQIIDGVVEETELQKLSSDAREFVNRILSLNKI